MSNSNIQKQVSNFSINQYRLSIWTELKALIVELSAFNKESLKKKDIAKKIEKHLAILYSIEQYFAFPGKKKLEKLQELLRKNDYDALIFSISKYSRLLVSESYPGLSKLNPEESEEADSMDEESEKSNPGRKIYFEVLFVEDLTIAEESVMRNKLLSLQEKNEQFSYDMLVQPSFQDALIALLFNFNIQAVVVRYAPHYKSVSIRDEIEPYVRSITKINLDDTPKSELGPLLGEYILQFRPELDVYYVTDTSLSDLKDSTLQLFRRIYYRREDIQELHLSIMRGIRERFHTPFFTALKEYSKKPTGIFHAMPISRGNSVFKSRWIRDFGDFYGRNLFLAETSSTTGGLDSLLQPTGPLKLAQEKAAEAYGSQRTFFVTNGTSTSNKIVMQALVEPEDLVLIDRDCHKSHHYGLVLSGAYPVYLDSYPIEKYSMYGAVPGEHIYNVLLQLKQAGRLDRVKMLLLTNSTFDGLVYNVEKIMERVLAIKPDMIFLWDEAWFGFAGFTLRYKQRTGMFVANKLYHKYKSDAYRKKYKKYARSQPEEELPILPDPDKVRIRVYSTQSTHKTLSSFRQGSMIHIWDEDFRKKAETTFLEAYMTHTSTSPNYQLLASLDAGRRQVQFEGYELVEKSIELSMLLRARIQGNPNLNKYFRVLTIKDLIPGQYRTSKLEEYYDPKKGWNLMDKAWEDDEFVLDPTKITLFIGETGVDGDTFKNHFLMDQFNIQINKTSRNTILLMTTIGTTKGSVTYLTNALLQISKQLDERISSQNQREKEIFENKVNTLTVEVPPLPDFSRFHSSFQAVPGVPGGNLRKAYFLAYDEDKCEYISLSSCVGELEKGRELVATSFVIPYPPGFPVLVPGQVVSPEIIQFLLALDVKEIHGYRSELGLRVFNKDALGIQNTESSKSASEENPIQFKTNSKIQV